MNEAAKSGLSPERLERLAETIRQDIEEERYDGAVITVARHGVVGLREAFGFAGRVANRPCRLDDVFNIMSVTKAFTDVIIFALIESGQLSLTTRVSDVIPEFKGGFKFRLIVLMFVSDDSAYAVPGSVIRLSSPQFGPVHVFRWVSGVIDSFRHPDYVREKQVIMEKWRKAMIAECSTGDDTLHIRQVYEHMEYTLAILRRTPAVESFLAELEERGNYATSSS